MFATIIKFVHSSSTVFVSVHHFLTVDSHGNEEVLVLIPIYLQFAVNAESSIFANTLSDCKKEVLCRERQFY